jgi:hypothetical protein
MPNTLRIKRRLTGLAGAPATLANAELAFNEVDNTLYYGKGDSSGSATSIIAIGGDGTFATKTYVDSALTGSNLSQYAKLASANTFTAANTFDNTSTLNISGTWQIDEVQVNTSAAELNVLDAVVAGTASAGKALVVDSNKDINLGTGDVTCTNVSATDVSSTTVTTTGNATIGGALTVTGNLTVNGTTTTVNSTTISVDDKNITLGDTASPSDAAADGGGITLKGTTDKTFNWVDATDAWTSSEHLAILGGKNLLLNGSTSGTITVAAAATAGTTTITFPATTGTVVTTGDTGTVTNTMLAGSIANAKLVNSSVTIGSTSVSLGGTATTIAGLTSVTSTTFVGALTGNASTATALATGRTISITGDLTYTSGSFDGTGNVTGSGTLATTGVSAGTYRSVTVDTKGRVTAGTNPTTLSGYGITDGVSLTANNALTGANTFTNTTGQTFRTAATNDGILVKGRAGGTNSFTVTLDTATLSANRAVTLPNVDGTVVLDSTVCSAIANCTLDGGTF